MSDADFAGCPDTFRSTSGYLVFMNGAVVAYYSGRQTVISLCTAMAETLALTKLTVKIKYLRGLLYGMGAEADATEVGSDTLVWVDNMAALSVATGENFAHETSKHLSVKVRYIQERLNRNMIHLHYIKTDENVSDMMTKSLTGNKFLRFRNFALGYRWMGQKSQVVESEEVA
jgi:hypothetical protein